jgi:hypothetical protein
MNTNTTETGAMMNLLVAYVAFAQANMDAHFDRCGISAKNRSTLVVESGRKYTKIIKVDGSSRSVFGFVNLATGDLHKADSWKKCGTVRGNLSGNFTRCTGTYGIG